MPRTRNRARNREREASNNNAENGNGPGGAENFQNINFAAVLDDLDRNPFGLGRGLWYIDGTFIFAFFGMVVALYLLIEDSEDRLGLTPEMRQERRRKMQADFHRHRSFMF